MAKNKKYTVSKKVKRAAKRGGLSIDTRGHLYKEAERSETNKTSASTEAIPVIIPRVVPVRALSDLLKQPVTAIIAKLFENGIQATINESVDFDTAAIIADEFGYSATSQEEEKKEANAIQTTKLKSAPRPPVIAVMGHVDHGKTTLLDAIRSTNVVSKEAGGITQHIGAYQVEVNTPRGDAKKSSTKKKPQKEITRRLTFLDTPGHEAFSAMRAQGANVTDMVVLVVAADDGVKPQTLEAISHARAASVPMIVAINKIDAPGADPSRVKRELAEHNLVPEEWGGKTVMVEVSAKKQTNLDTLLEIISLSADLQDLLYHPKAAGSGVIIESKIKPGLGPVATVLVKNGVFHQGAHIIIGDQVGKIKTMESDSGRIKTASASTPVQISGFKKVPQVGEKVNVVASEREAKEIIEERLKKDQVKSFANYGLAEVSQAIKSGQTKELNIVLKADVQGSLDAIKASLGDIKSDDVSVNFISTGIGQITESDINLALSAQAIVVAFNVPIAPNIKKLANEQSIKISRYDVIYELINDIKAALQGLLEPEIVETEIGRLKVIKVFHRTQTSGIVGGLVTKGLMRPGLKFRAKRLEETLGEGTVEKVQIGPGVVDVAKQNEECGISYSGNIKFKPDDVVFAYQTEEILKTI
ncbi:translation initiation factor IF-2 [Patescibacteria group bacterium]|nr:translation initiation factor IF-2 [Patescibacteria group bacterium]